jgi:DNA-binding NtrC family response regulator
MPSPLRLLLVEDSADDELLVLRQLRRGGYEPDHVRVDTAPAMEAALDSGQFDIVIADYSMPRFNGLEALALLRQRDADTPFILVSAQIGEEVAVGAMKAGANDYMMKQGLARLDAAVERELRDAEERRARRRAEAELAQRNQELERRLIELGALNRLFQQRVSQRFDAFTAYTELREEVEALYARIGQMVERLRGQPLPDAEDLLSTDPGEGRGR